MNASPKNICLAIVAAYQINASASINYSAFK